MDKRFEALVRNQFHAAAFNPPQRDALIELLRTDKDALAFAREELVRTDNPMLQERCNVTKTTFQMLKRAIEEAEMSAQHDITVEVTK